MFEMQDEIKKSRHEDGMNMVKLGDIATYVNGYAFKPDDRGDYGLPIIRIQDLTGNTYDLGFYDGDYPKKIEINNGDILISWSASLGVYEWKRGKALLNQHIFKVVFDKEVDVSKKYFVYAVKYKLEELSRKSHGATMKHVIKKDFDNTKIPFPSFVRQKEIAERLEKTSKIISGRKKQLQKLDELIQARFVEMFGGLHNSKLYPYVSIETFTDVTSGGTPNRNTKEYWENGNIRWVKTTELHNNFITDTEEYITRKGIDNSSAKVIPAHSILVAMYGQGKTRGMTGYLLKECTTNQACACILPCKRVDQKYLWYYMILSYDKLRGMAKGGNQPNLNIGIIKRFQVLVPPIELQSQFADFVNQVNKSKVEIQQALEKTQLLFDSLMQQYFG